MDKESAARSEIAGSVAVITLNRPHRLNAFDSEMHLALRAALNRIEQDSAVRALIVTGIGREHDSLKASILGADATPDTPEFDVFIKKVVREMT